MKLIALILASLSFYNVAFSAETLTVLPAITRTDGTQASTSLTKLEARGFDSEEISQLSSAEKFSLLVGDYSFSLVKTLNNISYDNGVLLDSSKKVEKCIISKVSGYPTHVLPVTMVSKDGIKVSLSSPDVLNLITSFAQLHCPHIDGGVYRQQDDVISENELRGMIRIP